MPKLATKSQRAAQLNLPFINGQHEKIGMSLFGYAGPIPEDDHIIPAKMFMPRIS